MHLTERPAGMVASAVEANKPNFALGRGSYTADFTVLKVLDVGTLLLGFPDVGCNVRQDFQSSLSNLFVLKPSVTTEWQGKCFCSSQLDEIFPLGWRLTERVVQCLEHTVYSLACLQHSTVKSTMKNMKATGPHIQEVWVLVL